MADQTYNEKLLDAMIRHQIWMLRFSAGVRNSIWELLDKSETDLRDKILARVARTGLDTPERLRKLDALLVALRETRIESWKEARREWFDQLKGFAVSEPEFLLSTIVGIVPVELGAVLPEAGDLRDLVTARPFMGKTLKQWADKVQADDIARIESQIKIGLVQGENGQEIARRVVGSANLRGMDGVTQITRRNAEAITRTVTNGIAAESRRLFAEANIGLADTELFVATLDSRTTPICRRFDGEQFKVGEPPFLPLHFGERSLRVLALNGEVIGERPRRDFTQRQLLREFAKKEGFDPVAKREHLPRGYKSKFDAFSRLRMRELTGRVPAKTTYAEWLKRQSAANQDDILGPTRGALFRRGGLSVDKFVDFNGRVYTLKELAKKHADAFRAANIEAANL